MDISDANALVCDAITAPQISQRRVAFLFPSLEMAPYWQPVFQRFTRAHPQTTIYTCCWEGFTPGFEASFNLQVLRGKWSNECGEYKKQVMLLPLNVIWWLIRGRTQVIFTSAYSMWTLLVLLLKPILRWQVVVLYEGSSSTYDYQDESWRLSIRRWMTGWADAAITNSPAGHRYLRQSLKSKSSRTFQQPYQVPDPVALLGAATGARSTGARSAHEFSAPMVNGKLPVRFLFVGRVVPRKGIQFLVEACEILHQRGLTNFTLTVAGEGAQRDELMDWSMARGLAIHWLGRRPYHEVGQLFKTHDVFVFPTLEDTWGMVLLEAMVFGKAILTSLDAGAAESMVTEGWNGYVIQSGNAQDIANQMQRLIENPDLISVMGQRSRDRMAQHTPDAATQFLLDVVQQVTDNRSPKSTLPLPQMQSN